MGTIYKEVVGEKNQKLSRIIISVILTAAGVDLVLLIGDFIKGNLQVIGYALVTLAFLSTTYFYRKSKVRYKYLIIDDEVIIEKLIRNKRSVEFNFKAKNIINMERINNKLTDLNASKKPRFFTDNKNNPIYECKVLKNNKTYSFYFQPSEELIKRINIIRSCRGAA